MTLSELNAALSRRNDLFLSGVDQGEIPAGALSDYDDASNAIIFVINDAAYCAVENPEDGYRSCLRDDIGVLPATFVRNRFAPVAVTVAIRATSTDGSQYGSAEVLVVKDKATGLAVLEVGTENADDYYPCFVATWSPQHLSVNSGVAAFHHEDKREDGTRRPRRGMAVND